MGSQIIALSERLSTCEGPSNAARRKSHKASVPSEIYALIVSPCLRLLVASFGGPCRWRFAPGPRPAKARPQGVIGKPREGVVTQRRLCWHGDRCGVVANCFAHAGLFRTVVSDPDDDQPDDDRTGSDLHEAVHEIAGQEVEGDFETFPLADAAVPVVAPATDAGIVYTWWPRRGRRAT
ncbi:hypothetical protein HPB48_014327 [Haemaphysalis longicornis]|uniref:Uncharacterized protein n=1 Tax=Haemaphysalis longicornis TaxID=44386 RepID=A0A9J6G2G8_HAELO|nr:hypothetical protein HPB48_014327 [Haemaphysalis longicornis]